MCAQATGCPHNRGGHTGPPLRRILQRARWLSAGLPRLTEKQSKTCPTLIRHGFAVPPSPLEGEGYLPGALARQTQAQKEDRTKSRFCEPRAQWPGRNRTQALLILRAGNPMPTQRDNPRKRGPGKGEYERVSAHFEPSPGAFCLLFRHGKRRSPPGTRAVRTKKLSLAAKLGTLRGGAPSRGPGQLLLPLRGNSPSRALHKKPLYHRPLIRPFGPPSPGEGLKGR